MCFSSPSAPATPAPPAAQAPLPAATVAPAEGTNRKDNAYLNQARGRNSLRIDKTQPNTGSTGAGLNIPS